MGGGWDRFTRRDGGSVKSNPTPEQERALLITCCVSIAVVIAFSVVLAYLTPAAAGIGQMRQPVMFWTWEWEGERGERMCGPTHECFGWMEIDDLRLCERVVDNILKKGAMEDHELFFCGYLYERDKRPH